MSKLLVDLNVWIDLASVGGDYAVSSKFIRLARERSDSICFPLAGYTAVYYVLRKIIGGRASVDFLVELSEGWVRMLAFGPQELAIAQSLTVMKDHEDASISATAITNRCSTIVTWNVKDFKNSPIKALTPEQVMTVS